MENIPDTPEGIILESLLEGMNQYYSAELSQKVKRGMRETRLKSYFQGDNVLYGYKLDGRKLVIDEIHSEVVKRIFEEFSKGICVREIIARLTAQGIYRNGKPLAMNTDYNILRCERYTGIYRKGEEVIDNMYPAIIPQDLFDSVQAILKTYQHGKNSIEVTYLLRHKLKCGYCGQSIIAEMGTGRNGERRYYYKCRGRKARVNDCHKSVVPKDVLEKMIINTTIEIMSRPHIMEYVIQRLIDLQEKIFKANTTLNSLYREQKQNETALNNLVTAIENGIISNTTNKRLHELESQQQDIERRILIEKSKTTVRYTEKELRTYIEQSLKLEPQLLINYFIKEIVLFDDKIQIHYNFPISNSPDNENGQGFLFYSETIETNLLERLTIELYI